MTIFASSNLFVVSLKSEFHFYIVMLKALSLTMLALIFRI